MNIHQESSVCRHYSGHWLMAVKKIDKNSHLQQMLDTRFLARKKRLPPWLMIGYSPNYSQ